MSKRCTVSYGLGNFVTIDLLPGMTLGDVLADGVLQQTLGFGDNIVALVNDKKATLDLELGSGDTVTLRPGAGVKGDPYTDFVNEQISYGVDPAQAAANADERFGRTDTTVQRLNPDGSVTHISGTRPVTAADRTQSYMDQLLSSMGQSLRTPSTGSMISDMYLAGKSTAMENLKSFPVLTQTALDATIQAATQLDAQMARQFQEALDSLYPRWREDMVGAATKAQRESVSLVESFRRNVMPQAIKAADTAGLKAIESINRRLSGDIPEDVAVQIRRQSAELAQQIGARGQAAKYLTARDLGLTSLEISERALAQAPAAFGLATTAYGAISQGNQLAVESGMNVTNLLQAYRAPQTSIPGVFGTAFSGTMNTATLSPNALVSGAQNAMSAAVQAAQFEQERRDTLLGLAISYSMDQQRLDYEQSRR